MFFSSRFKELGVNQLEDIYHLEDDLLKADFGSDSNNWIKARQALPSFQKDLQEFEVLLMKQLKPTKSKWNIWGTYLVDTHSSNSLVNFIFGWINQVMNVIFFSF